MSIVSDVTSSKFNFVMLQVDTMDFSLSNSMPMDLLNATEEFSTCANLKCTCTFISIRSINIFSIWPHVAVGKQANQHTHASCNATPLVWGLTQALSHND